MILIAALWCGCTEPPVSGGVQMPQSLWRSSEDASAEGGTRYYYKESIYFYAGRSFRWEITTYLGGPTKRHWGTYTYDPPYLTFYCDAPGCGEIHEATLESSLLIVRSPEGTIRIFSRQISD